MPAVFARVPSLFCSLVEDVFSASGTGWMALASLGCQTGNSGGFDSAVFAIEGRHRVLGMLVKCNGYIRFSVFDFTKSYLTKPMAAENCGFSKAEIGLDIVCAWVMCTGIPKISPVR